MSGIAVAEFGFKDLNPGTVHVLQAALERKAITTTEIAVLVPRGTERDLDRFSGIIRFIKKTLADHNVALVADSGLAAHLKENPIPKVKKEREFKTARTTEARAHELDDIEKHVEHVRERGEDYEYDALKMYYNDINGYRLLSPDEEIELGRRILEGDLDARNTLVKHNLRLVRWAASKYTWSSLPFEDLIQEGNIGLMTAANRFDYRLGHRFTTYATHWIRQAIGRAIQNYGHTIRVPVHMLQLINKVRKTAREIEQETGEDATERAIAKRIDLPTKTVRKILSVSASMSNVVSLDVEVSSEKHHAGEGTSTLREFLPDTASIGPEMYLEALEELTLARARLEKTMVNIVSRAGISERDVEIFKYFYGLGDDGVRKTFERVGTQFDVTRERIRQIIATIWEKVDELGGDMDHKGFIGELFRIEELEKIVLSAQ